MKPYYDDGTCVIYHGDCREILPRISADITVTSPPYNRGARINGSWEGIVTESCKSSRFRDGYGVCTDDLPWSDYRAWLRTTIEMIWQSTTGALWLNLKPRIVNDLLWLPTEATEGLPLRQIVTWDAGPGINFHPGAFVSAYEWVMLIAEPGWRFVDRAAGARGDVWRFTPAHTWRHPAAFPLTLVKACLLASPGETVLDPFMGSGTTLRAAKDLGRRAIGIEIEEKYCEIAARRLGQEVLAL